jgi:HEAT repeat protein
LEDMARIIKETNMAIAEVFDNENVSPKLKVLIEEADEQEKVWIGEELVKRIKSDTDPNIRRRYMVHLLAFPSIEAEALREILVSDSDRSVREFAVYMLGRAGSEEDLDDLLEVIRGDKGAFPHGRDLAGTAYSSIGLIGGDKAAGILLKLWNDKEFVPDHSLYSMGSTGSPLVLDLLKEILEKKEGRFRPNAAAGLSALASRTRDNKEMAGQVRELLRVYVKDHNPQVRRAAIAGFYSIGQAEDLPLMNSLINDPYNNVVSYREDGEVKEKTVYPIRENAQWAITKITNRISQTKKNVVRPIKAPAVQVAGEKGDG